MVKQKHKHHQLIKLWADGEKIQYRFNIERDWDDIENPIWNLNTEYRVKPTSSQYRLYWFFDKIGQFTIGLIQNKEEEFLIFNHPNFIKWISNWITEELPSNITELK